MGAAGTAAGRRDGGALRAVRGSVTGTAAVDRSGVGLTALVSGTDGAAFGESTPPSPVVTPTYVSPTNAVTARPTLPAARYGCRRRGRRSYASYSGCSTSVRRLDSGTGRVTSYRSDRHSPRSSRPSHLTPYPLLD